MKLLHLSDLHLGKRLMEVSLIEDQQFILAQILDIADAEMPDAVIIAGDVYDKAVPSAEAVTLFDDFLWRLSEHDRHIFIISGNHDSPERIAFGGRLMERSGIHLSPVWDGTLSPITLSDEFGSVDFFLLPFIKPVHVRRAFPDADVESYTDAVRYALGEAEKIPGHRRVLITHQFITGAERSDSEEVSVGGSDNVDVSALDGFDYVALGHIHRPQLIRPNVYYCGTPLKYSFSEASHEKSAAIVELSADRVPQIRRIPLRPLRDLREIRGTYDELTLRAFYVNTRADDYLHITLTDEDDIPDAMARLRVIYPNLLKLDYDNRRTRASGAVEAIEAAEELSPMELFAQFYEKQNDRQLDNEQRDYLRALMEEIWEEV